MLLHIPEILTAARVAEFRKALAEAVWTDGALTAGHQSSRVKDNTQLREDDPAAREMGNEIIRALQVHPLFLSAAVPLKIFPPLFNRYGKEQAFGNHFDNAIRSVPGTSHRVRTDLSATLFLSDPADYDGGELVVEDSYGLHRARLPAGDLVLYPASSLHHVTPVTRGERLASFFWVQSMVRDEAARTLLFDLDLAVQQIAHDMPDHPSTLRLTGIYHNLLRRWAQV